MTMGIATLLELLLFLYQLHGYSTTAVTSILWQIAALLHPACCDESSSTKAFRSFVSKASQGQCRCLTQERGCSRYVGFKEPRCQIADGSFGKYERMEARPVC